MIGKHLTARKILHRAVKTQKGLLTVAHHKIKRRRPKVRKLKCPACTEVFKLVRDLNAHVANEHGRRFKCRYCTKNYASSNAKDRHQKTHQPLPFSCDGTNKKGNKCKMVFQYRYQLEEHKLQHSNRCLYPCERGCGKSYPCKRSMLQHMQVHSDEKFTCSECAKEFKTKGYLRQHMQAAHSGGFVCRCGFIAKNPVGRQKHQNSCVQCIKIKRKKKAIKTAKK